MERPRSAAVTLGLARGRAPSPRPSLLDGGMQIVTLLDAGKVDDTDAAGGIDSNKPAPVWVKVNEWPGSTPTVCRVGLHAPIPTWGDMGLSPSWGIHRVDPVAFARGAERRGDGRAAQRGDADAYGELLNEIGPVLMRFLRARVRDAQEAEDLYQETLHGHPSRATRLRCRTGRSSRGCSPLPGTSSPRTPSGTACARRARCWSPPRPSGRRRATAT